MPEERIYVACDRCGRPVLTGLVIDAESLEQARARLAENRTKCPSCDHWIVWSKTKIWPESVVVQRFGKVPGAIGER